jgi:hypothetical protein
MEHFIFPRINIDYTKETNINALTEESEKVIYDICSSIDNLQNINYKKKLTTIKRSISPKKSLYFSRKIIKSTKIKLNSEYNFDESIGSEYNKKVLHTEAPKEICDSSLSFFNIDLPSVKLTECDIILNRFSRPKARLSDIYHNFDGISNEYYKITNIIEKSKDKYKKNIQIMQNKEKIEQNKLLGDINLNKNKCFTDPPKKVKVIKDLDKNEVLKDYNLINKMKDDYAEYVWKKFEVPIYVSTNRVRFQKNHKEIMNLLDNLKIKKKYK